MCATSPPRSGFPIILKPAAGAGASGAERVNSPDELDEAIARSGVDHGAEVAVEEFVDGHEGFYDTISIDGHVAVDFVTHYYPNVLEAMRTRWISPQFVTTNRIDDPSYAELRELGQRVITALGIGTSATHMEWFAGSKGLYFSEIGARPPACGHGTCTPPPTASTSIASGPTPSSTDTSSASRRGSSPPG